MKDLQPILSRFKISGTLDSIESLNAGLINDSYKVTTLEADKPDYVLQRINHSIFKNIPLLEKNIYIVTNHIKNKLIKDGAEDIDRKVLQFIETTEGGYVLNNNGNYWRLMIFIPDAITLSEVNPESSYFAGKTFGEFQYMLSDLEEELGETIPDFHNMEFRLQQFHDAIKDDKAGRLESVKDIVNEIELMAQEMTFAEKLHREGKLPKRICHCDTKVNNMMYDKSGKPLCVIDLDTMMPAYIFSDYGDFLRTGANTAAEDESDFDKVDFNIEIFKSFTKGYLEGASPFITKIEIEYLPKAIALFPYMQAVRFFTDYINGDIYYKTSYPEHNLIRTKNQLKLLKSIKEKSKEIESYINASI